MAPLPVGQGSKEPARGGVLGVSSATSFFLEFPLQGRGLDSGGYDIYWPDPQQPHHVDIAFLRRS